MQLLFYIMYLSKLSFILTIIFIFPSQYIFHELTVSMTYSKRHDESYEILNKMLDLQSITYYNHLLDNLEAVKSFAISTAYCMHSSYYFESLLSSFGHVPTYAMSHIIDLLN